MNGKNEYIMTIKYLGFNNAMIFINKKNKNDIIQWEFREYNDELIEQLLVIVESMIYFQQPVLFSTSLSPFRLILFLKGDKIEIVSEGRNSFWELGKIKPIEEIIQKSERMVIVSLSDFINAIKDYYLKMKNSSPTKGYETEAIKIIDDLENHFKEFQSIYENYLNKRKNIISRVKESYLEDYLFSQQVLWSQGKIKDYSKQQRK